MKYLLLLVSALFLSIGGAHAQFYDNICSYNVNGTPVYGAKIKTNLPFASSVTMPAISIIGYDYSTGSAINLSLTYYVFNAAFTGASVSSSGAANPPIILANENGKVSIFIDYKGYFMRFGVSAFAKGLAGETPANFSGWTVVDSPLIATAANQVVLLYKNSFSGTVAIPDSGRLAIGTVGATAVARAALDIASTATDTLTSVFARQSIGNLSGRGSLLGVYNYPNVSNAPMFGLQSYYHGSLNAGVVFNRGTGVNGGFLTFLTNDGTEQMRINANGNVGIGTTNPGTYKLAVEGTIGARKVDVKMTGWADFVFQDGYKLPTLQHIENYIFTHRHLPGMPSEKEVLSNGLDLGEFNKLLLQKVEELSLYIIAQDKQYQLLAAQLQQLKEQVSHLSK